MTKLFELMGRMIVVAFGVIAAGAVAAFVAVTLGLEKLTHFLHAQGDPTVLFGVMDRAWQMRSALTIVPALGVVILGEVARIRSATYYIVAGAVALAGLPLVGDRVVGMAQGLNVNPAIGVFATAGFCGGFVYWLIAGRNA